MLSTTSNSESQLIRELRRDSEKTVVMLAVLARASVYHWHASMWECIPVMQVIHEWWVINVQLSDPSLHSHWHTSVKVPESLSSFHCNYSRTSPPYFNLRQFIWSIRKRFRQFWPNNVASDGDGRTVTHCFFFFNFSHIISSLSLGTPLLSTCTSNSLTHDDQYHHWSVLCYSSNLSSHR